jgi:trans-aconitate 2-methyltransferase
VVEVRWDAADYRENSSMQLVLGSDFLARIPLADDAAVLDVGCGDGKVTALVAARVPRGRVVGIDPSPAMVDLARAEHPGIEFRVLDVRDLDAVEAFDVVVSFTALHWVIERHDQALRGICRALRHGGRLALQFPGAGNAAALFTAAEAVMAEPRWRDRFAGFRFPWLFPTPEAYRGLVEATGLVPERIDLVPRDVVHAGQAGLAGWIRTTWMPYTDRLRPHERDEWIDEVVAAYAIGMPPDADGTLHVPSCRLEVEAVRP